MLNQPCPACESPLGDTTNVCSMDCPHCGVSLTTRGNDPTLVLSRPQRDEEQPSRAEMEWFHTRMRKALPL